ncbi:MAG: hypothetical protein H6Q65_1480 [Firmicutes bacterium]|nr:hypothetical protein [Bacillota bacterium]
MEEAKTKKNKSAVYIALACAAVALGICELWPSFYTEALLLIMTVITVIQIFRYW